MLTVNKPSDCVNGDSRLAFQRCFSGDFTVLGFFFTCLVEISYSFAVNPAKRCDISAQTANGRRHQIDLCIPAAVRTRPGPQFISSRTECPDSE